MGMSLLSFYVRHLSICVGEGRVSWSILYRSGGEILVSVKGLYKISSFFFFLIILKVQSGFIFEIFIEI